MKALNDPGAVYRTAAQRETEHQLPCCEQYERPGASAAYDGEDGEDEGGDQGEETEPEVELVACQGPEAPWGAADGDKEKRPVGYYMTHEPNPSVGKRVAF